MVQTVPLNDDLMKPPGPPRPAPPRTSNRRCSGGGIGEWEMVHDIPQPPTNNPPSKMKKESTTGKAKTKIKGSTAATASSRTATGRRKASAPRPLPLSLPLPVSRAWTTHYIMRRLRQSCALGLCTVRGRLYVMWMPRHARSWIPFSLSTLVLPCPPRMILVDSRARLATIPHLSHRPRRVMWKRLCSQQTSTLLCS